MSDHPPSPGSQGSAPRDPEPLTDLLRRLFGERTVPEIALPGHDELAPDPDAPGSTRSFGRYELRGELARGGMGAILRVFDKDLRRSLAMKVILGRGEAAEDGTPQVDEVQLARFLEEAQVTGQLDHPSVVPVHELGIDPSGRVYFTMKLVKGETLRDVFDKVKVGRDGWSRTRALGVLLKVCEAMAYAHAKGVIHRDLKPANVMVGKYGEVYVMDWGLARVLGEDDRKDVRIRPPAGLTSEVRSPRAAHRGDTPDSPLYTMDGDVVGTPAYMPPEQAAGDVARMGPHSDVYAVGAMLYHLLAGHMPYLPQGAVAHNYAVWHRVQEGPPASIAQIAPDAPAEIVAICERAMAREVGRRYRDMEQLARDLRAFLEGRVVAAYETGAWAEARKWVARNRGLAAALTAAAVLLVLGSAVAWALKLDADVQREASERSASEARLQKERAERSEIAERRRAEEAEQQRQRADALAQVADERRRAAEESERFALARGEEAQENAYVVSVQAAATALRSGEHANLARFLAQVPEGRRGWEWKHLDALRDRSLLVLKGHSEPILACAFSPDSTRVLTASADQTARVWDATRGVELAVLRGHSEGLPACAFSPDGTRVLTASWDGTARLWDPGSGAEIAVLRGHSQGLTACAFGPDGARVLTASMDNTARLWDAISGAELVVLRGHSLWIGACAFSPDGARVLTVSYDHTARLWDAASGAELAVLRGHTGWLNAYAFSADGMHVLTASQDQTARLWDATSGAELAVLRGHTGSINACAVSPGGTRLLTASHDQTARLWDATNGAELVVLRGHTGSVNACAVSPDGALVLTASHDQTARLWDAASGAELAVLRGHTGSINACAVSPDGALVLTASSDQTARLWDATSGAEPPVLRGHSGRLTACAFGPDGTRVLTASNDQTARLWSASSGTELAVLLGHTGSINACAASSDGTRVLTASHDQTARLWDAASGVGLTVLRGHSEGLTACAFGPDGTRVLTASWDRTARLWDAISGAELAVLRGHSDGLTACAFSPDGARVLTASPDQTARLWDATSGAQLAVLRGHTDGLAACAFSPDGTRMATASADQTARLWDAASGSQIAVLRGHTGWVTACAFSPDGARLLTASHDRTARLWNATSGAELAVLRGHTDKLTACAFSPDGTRVLTASDDQTARLWDSVPYREQWAERRRIQAADRAGRSALEQALDQEPDLSAAGRRLRLDANLDTAVRQSALDRLITSAVAARAEADRLGIAILDPTALESRLARLEAHPRLVEHAWQHAAPRASDPEWLLDGAWDIALPSTASSNDVAMALRAVDRARTLAPGETRVLSIRGALLYRQGDDEAAAQDLRRARAERGDRVGILAFLAMAEHRLGNRAVAADVLESLREVNADAKEPFVTLQREVESLLASPTPPR